MFVFHGWKHPSWRNSELCWHYLLGIYLQQMKLLHHVGFLTSPESLEPSSDLNWGWEATSAHTQRLDNVMGSAKLCMNKPWWWFYQQLTSCILLIKRKPQNLSSISDPMHGEEKINFILVAMLDTILYPSRNEKMKLEEKIDIINAILQGRGFLLALKWTWRFGLAPPGSPDLLVLGTPQGSPLH